MSKKKKEELNISGDDDVVDLSKSESNTDSQKTYNSLITMEAFLSNSKKIKQEYNKYVPIGFSKYVEILRRTKPKAYKFFRTQEEWLSLFEKYANS